MKFYPTFYFKDIYEITPLFLVENGVEALILDVDNTLISNMVNDPTERVASWINSLRAQGIKLCILSNGKGARVKRFNENLGLPVIFDAKKPLKSGFAKALELMDVTASRCAVVGDQLFTDVLGANLSKIKSVLVVPIDEHEQRFIRFKRVLERPFIKKIKAGKRSI